MKGDRAVVASEVVRARLPGQPSSVPVARRLVRSAADTMFRDADVSTAELLVSELVTNAVVHAGTPVDLVLSVLADTTVEVEVADASTDLPRSRHHAATAGTGRGLGLLDELSDCWGVRARPTGKTVWFRLSTRQDGRPRGQADATGDPRSQENVVVELLNVPLLLHASWQQQVQALLRDYLLATLDDHGPQPEVLAHADCSNALSLLAEHIPAPVAPPRDGQVSGDVDDAADPSHEVWWRRTAVPVPCGSVPHFATLDETVERALELADAGRLLAPAPDPAARSLLRWISRQVAEQAKGMTPTPWHG